MKVPGREPVVELKGLGIHYRLHRQRGQSLKRFLMSPARWTPPPLVWALREIDLECAEGEVLGVVGPNGAGKSTLCLVLAGILPPDEGDATVRGEVSALLRLGAAFQRHLTGRENIYLFSSFLGHSREEVDGWMDEIVSFAELEEFIDQPIRFYSSGMRSRLAFSVATAIQPEILILDEALSAGDASFRAKCRMRIEELMEQSKLIVVVSHQLSFLRTVSTRCLWLEKGRIRDCGDPTTVLDAYEAASGVAPRPKRRKRKESAEDD